MRLIDADALMLKICGEGCGCMPDQCGYPCCDIGGNEKRCRTGEYVENAPAIDAIPVKWLKAQIRSYTGDVSDIGKSARNGTIKDLIRKWQKEQEVEDDAAD